MSGDVREEALTAGGAVFAGRETELVGRARARSPEAWTEIYNTHYRAIYRYARARVFDESTAEDMTSAVFLAALKGIDSYDYRGRPLLAWLYRIARNVVASHQRKLLYAGADGTRTGLDLPRQVIWHLMRRSRAGGEAEADDTGIEIASSEGDPGMTVERLDVRRALGKLTEAQREAIILRFMLGLNTQEVAELMGKAPAAVYSLQARALLTLRELLS